MKTIGPAQPTPEFAVHAEDVVQRLRSALADVIAGLPGFRYRRPNDLALELGLDPKLAWKVGRCINGSDPFAAAQFIPGPAGMRAFLAAARRRQAPPTTVHTGEEAYEAFRVLVHAHAYSRKYFNMLAAGHATTEQVRSDVEHRRLAFDGNTYVWGVQARTIFRTNLLYPSSDSPTWDLVAIRGWVDLCRMRPNVTWRLPRTVSVDDAHRVHTNTVHAALDPHTPATADAGAPLLRRFCTQPLPQFRPVTAAHGGVEYEFVQNSVGNTARLTCVTAETLRAVEPRHRTDLYEDFCAMFAVRTPAEVLVFDLLVHRELFVGGGPFRAELYSDLFGGGPEVRYEASDRLELHERLEELGYGAGVAHTSHIPRYPEMLRYACSQMKWDESQFRVYRLRLQYPPLPTTVMLRCALPSQSAP